MPRQYGTVFRVVAGLGLAQNAPQPDRRKPPHWPTRVARALVVNLLAYTQMHAHKHARTRTYTRSSLPTRTNTLHRETFCFDSQASFKHRHTHKA